MKFEVASALGIACVAALTAACGGSSSTSGGTSDTSSPMAGRETCALLSADDIRGVMGIAPGQPKADDNGCTWPSADGSNEFLVQLTVAPTVIRSYDELAKQYREELETDPAAALHRIDGVGQFAIGFNELPIVQIFGDSGFVQVYTVKHEERHALDLAKRAFARLD